MRAEILRNLQSSILPYSAFSEDWKRKLRNTLNKLKKGILELNAQTDFTTILANWKPFLKHVPIISTITEKSNAGRIDLNKWLLDSVITELETNIHIHPQMNSHHGQPYELTEINHYDRKTSGKFASILKKFGHETIADLALAVLQEQFLAMTNIILIREVKFQCRIEKMIFGIIMADLHWPPSQTMQLTFN